MREAMQTAPKIDEEVTGAPVEAHGYVVTPVARVRGTVGSQATGQGSGIYGWAAIRPQKMRVQALHAQGRNGDLHEVRLVDVEGQVIRALVTVGAVVAVVSLLMSALRKFRR